MTNVYRIYKKVKLTIGTVRTLVREAKIKASPAYIKKEKTREELQQMIIQRISSNEIASVTELETFFSDISLAMTALKSIPFEVWEKLAATKV